MKIHLIDGTFELFRAFYGAPSRLSPAGKEIGATVAFMRSLRRFLSTDGVTHVAIAFDTVIESFRNDLFDGYKTGDGIDPLLWAQAPLVERASRAMGVVVWSMIEFEADDAIATAAKRFSLSGEVDQIIICSPDKDFAQVVEGQRIVLWDRLRDKLLDEEGVKAKFGVAPASIPDFLALVGDNADGIPGIPKWGAKSASHVLGRYAHLENIPQHSKDWDIDVRGALALSESLASHKNDSLLYRQLATLRLDVPLKERVEHLEWKGAQQEELRLLCEELGLTEFPQLFMPR